MHVLKNIMIPIVTVIGLEFGGVIAFAIVTETIFAWPGMGKLIIDSIAVLDRPIIVAYLLVIVILFVVHQSGGRRALFGARSPGQAGQRVSTQMTRTGRSPGAGVSKAVATGHGWQPAAWQPTAQCPTA